MNEAEATTLVTVLNRAGLIGAMEGQGAVWHMALTDVPFQPAKAAATELIATRTSEQRWVTPGDVRAMVRTRRKRHLDGMPSVQVPQSLDGDPAREIAWRRAYIEAYGNTGDHEQAASAACTTLGVQPDRPVLVAAPRPAELARLAHGAQCACGCLTKPIRPGEGDPR
ncbi:hypothetical protein [Isoptericola sp. NPDC055881]